MVWMGTWLGVSLLAAGLWWLVGRGASHRRPVSRDWQMDQERRAWASGVDQAKVAQWPIRKHDHSIH